MGDSQENKGYLLSLLKEKDPQESQVLEKIAEMMMNPPISELEMTLLIMMMINTVMGSPLADNDHLDNTLTVAAPATGQLFTVTVTERK
jgi:hypothetical protein